MTRTAARLVVRNGRHRPRTIDTGVGTVEIAQPRINDKRVGDDGTRFRFTSKILPPYLRRTKNLEEFIPWLYLKGISTNDFTECLQHLTGMNSSASLSPTTVVRLKEAWIREHKAWSDRSVSARPAIRLHLGRWRALQHPHRRRPAVHSRAHGRHKRRQEGTAWPLLMVFVKAPRAGVTSCC